MYLQIAIGSSPNKRTLFPTNVLEARLWFCSFCDAIFRWLLKERITHTNTICQSEHHVIHIFIYVLNNNLKALSMVKYDEREGSVIEFTKMINPAFWTLIHIKTKLALYLPLSPSLGSFIPMSPRRLDAGPGSPSCDENESRKLFTRFTSTSTGVKSSSTWSVAFDVP